MSERNPDRDDSQLAAVLHDRLAARDRHVRPPRFAAVWPSASATHRSTVAWRPVVAAALAAVVVAGLSWTLIYRAGAPDSSLHAGRIDPSLARRLSSPEYWSVPTDELLVFAAAPLSAELPSPTGFEISLEESLL